MRISDWSSDVCSSDLLPSTLLLVGGAGGQPDLAGLAGVRLAGPVPADAAPSRVEGLSRFDIVWLREADRLADDRFAALMTVMTERECGLLCGAPLAEVDRVAAAIPASVRTDRLVGADRPEPEMASRARKQGR